MIIVQRQQQCKENMAKIIFMKYARFIVVIGFSVLIYTVDGVYSDFKVLFTNYLILAISFLFMDNGDLYNYSLNKILMLFSFFFFGIAPALQYQHGIVFGGLYW